MKLKLMGIDYKRADAADGETVHTITVTTRPRAPDTEASVDDQRPFFMALAGILQNAAGIFAGMAEAPPERPCKVVPFGPVDGATPPEPPDGRAS